MVSMDVTDHIERHLSISIEVLFYVIVSLLPFLSGKF